MFFVLKCENGGMLARGPEGDHRTTHNLQEAKLFNMELTVETVYKPEDPATMVAQQFYTTGELTVKVKGDQIPAGLPGKWEVCPVDVRLA